MLNSFKTLLVASPLTAGAGGGSDGKDLAAFTGVWTSTAVGASTTCTMSETGASYQKQ